MPFWLWGLKGVRGLPSPALGVAVGLAVHLEGVDAICEPVEECAGETIFSECGFPLVRGQVRGDDGRAALVALPHQFEEQLDPSLREGHEAEFVDDQQLLASELTLQPPYTAKTFTQKRF